MKQLLKIVSPLVFGAFVIALATPSLALVDIRSHYNLEITEDSPLLGDSKKISPLAGLGGDVIASLPVLPLGFGLRYENLTLEEGDPRNYKFELERTAAIINIRPINTLFFIGAIGTFGLRHKAKQNNAKTKVDLSYSAGAEMGFKFLSWMAGVEIGHLWLKADILDSRDLSGLYAKTLIGFNF